jgi:DNA-binding SARP family transcriptional activator
MPPEAPRATTRIELCGSLLAEIEGRRIDDRLASGKELALFGYLVAHRERASSRDELIDALWPVRPPASPAAALSTVLSRLRRVLALPALEGRSTLRLKLPPRAWVDLEVAERAADEGAIALADGAADEALAAARVADEITRRPLLRGVELPWVEERQRDLDELRQGALDTIARAHLALGGPQLGEAERVAQELIEANPYRESGYTLLMEIHAARGNVAEALRVYELLRVLLREELGTSPAAGVTALHQRLLTRGAPPPSVTTSPSGASTAGSGMPEAPNGAPTSAREPSVPFPASLEAATRKRGRFVGRAGEVEALLLQSAGKEGEPRLKVVVIHGEPGIGKTRLTAEAATLAHDRGAIVLYGAGDESRDAPYQPLVEALDHLGAHAPERVLRRLGDSRAQLERLLPSLGRRSTRPARLDPDAGPAGDQYVLFSSIAALLAGVSATAPLFVVLDDIHWAGAPPLRLLTHLLRSSDPVRGTVVVTYRSPELPEDEAVRDALAAIERDDRTTVIGLEGLEEDEVVVVMEALSRRSLDERERDFARTLRRDTGGNPLFVTEILRSLADSSGSREKGGAWISPRPAEAVAPRSVRQVIRRRVDRLGTQTAAVLGVAAVLGQDFGAEALADIAGVARDRLGQVLDDAERAALIAPDPRSTLRYRFAHPLIGEVLYQDQGTARRARAHRAIGEALEETRAGKPGRSAAELAHHWALAFPPDNSKALAYATAAGTDALERLEADPAERWFERALELQGSEAPFDDHLRCELLIGLGVAERRQGRHDFRETLLEASRLAQRTGHEEQLVRATLANTRGFVSASGTVDDERIAMLDAAIEAIGERASPERARLLATLAAELSFAGGLERRRALADEALRLARSGGDRRTLCRVLWTRFVPIWVPATLEERLSNSDESVRLADELGDRFEQFNAIHWRAVALVQAGRLEEANRDVEREQRLGEGLGEPTTRWLSTYDRANLAIISGRLDEAEQLANRALEIATESKQPDALPFYASQLTNIFYERGRLGELQSLVAETVATNPGIPAFRAVLALAYAEAELWADSRNTLAIDAATGFSELPEDVTWLAAHAIYAHVCADVEDRHAAAALFDRLSPFRGQIVYTGISAWGSVDHALGRLATVLARHREAEQLLREAGECYRAIGAPIWSARADVDSAFLYISRRAEGDFEAAKPLLERAVAEAGRLGVATVRRRAETLTDRIRAGAILRGASGAAARLELQGLDSAGTASSDPGEASRAP